jgi:hypothetical protein
MLENIEQELVQNSRLFYEAFLPGAVTRLRNQALAMVVGVADKEDALEGLDRTQLVDAVRKFLEDWKVAGGSVDAMLEEASDRNEFRVQAPSEIYVTPFPLVLRCQTCGALENHDKPRRQHEHILATTYNRISGGDSNFKAFIRCSEKGCGGRLQQVPFVVVHRCGHISAMSIPPPARGISRLGLRHNNGMFRQNTFFDISNNDNVATAYTEMCTTCSVSRQPDPSMLQKGTTVNGGDAFFPQVIQFVALSKKPGELVSNIQSELVRLPEGSLTGRAKDLAEGMVYSLLGCVSSENLQAALLQILEGGEVNGDDQFQIHAEREKLENEIAMLDALIASGTSLESVRDASKERLSKLISKMGAAEGTFEDVRNYIDNDTVLLDLICQRRTMEAVLLRHDVGRQGVAESIESTTDSVVKLSRFEDWQYVQSTYGIHDIAHIPDLKVILAAVGFTREKREPERTLDEIPVKLNPFEDRIRSSSKGKAVLYAFSAQTEALWIRLDPIKVLHWCVKHAGWDSPSPEMLQSRARAQAYLLAFSPALTAAPGSAVEITKTIGSAAAAPFHLMHSISHSLMLTARRHSGYDSQSLTEYLLPMDLSFLIYVTSVQNYTSGGLLTLFQHYLRHWFEDASLHAFNCAFDPICSDVGSACPGCIQIPRGCETFNAGVSRSYLHGGYVDKAQSLWVPTGYWQ